MAKAFDIKSITFFSFQFHWDITDIQHLSKFKVHSINIWLKDIMKCLPQ